MASIRYFALYIVLPIVVLVLLMMYYPGSFEKIKDVIKGAGKYVQFGAEEEAGAKPMIPEAHQKALDRLLQTMKEMRDSKAKNCFANYGGLPALGEKGTSFSFTYNEKNDKTVVIVRGGKEGQQEVANYELEGIKPCVIAGHYDNENPVAQNFYYSVLAFDKVLSSSQVRGDIFSYRKNVLITGRDPSIAPKGNLIRVDLDMIDKWSNNFRDGGWLFTPDNEHICFFPTVPGRDSCENNEQGGLDDDCLGEADPENLDSVSAGISRGRLQFCPSVDTQIKYKWIELVTQGEADPSKEISPQRIENKCIEGISGCHTSEKGGCNIFKDRVGEIGCAMIATDIDWFGPECAYGEAIVGTKIGKKDIFVSGPETGFLNLEGDPDALTIFSRGFRWESPLNDLICASDNYWYPCNIENFPQKNVINVQGDSNSQPKFMRCTVEGWKAFSDLDEDTFEDKYDPTKPYLGHCVGKSVVGGVTIDRGSCSDNCPEIFNPDQEDSDYDGVGDACDLCPDLNAGIDSSKDKSNEKYWFGENNGCPQLPHADDLDSDGIIDVDDNCPPSVCIGQKQKGIGNTLITLKAKDCANNDQKDENRNGIGDICDRNYVVWVES